jgi:hypothetical protein
MRGPCPYLPSSTTHPYIHNLTIVPEGLAISSAGVQVHECRLVLGFRLDFLGSVDLHGGDNFPTAERVVLPQAHKIQVQSG